MIVCTTTKPPKEEVFSTSDHDVKGKGKDTRIDPKTRKERIMSKEMQSHSILERIETYGKPCEKQNVCKDTV